MNEEKEIKKIKTAIYTRIGTDEKKQKYSLKEQLERINSFCNFKRLNGIDYEIVKVFKEEQSAKNMKDRPQFLKMVDMVKKGEIEHIIIFKLDRLTRSVKDLEEILVMIEEYDCGLTSVSEEIDTKGIMGKFCIRLMILVAQLELEQISFRTTIAMEGAAKVGVVSGQPPLGYTKELDVKNKTLKKGFIIDEETAPTIRHIFDLCLKGYSYFNIAKILIEEGNTMRKWKDTAIQKILNNRIYCGDVEHRKSLKEKETIIYEDVVPPIISKETFYDCQRAIEKNKESNGNSILPYMFGKTLYCDRCGKMLRNSTNNDKGIKYYECKCFGSINEDKLEKLLIGKLNDLDSFNMALTYNAIMVDDDRLTEILNNVDLDVPDERLKNRKNELRDVIDDLVINQIKNQNEIKDKLWVDMNYEEKKDFISSYIDAIFIDKIKGKTQHDYTIKIKRIVYKQTKLNKLFTLRAKGLVDAYGKNGSNVWSIAVIKDKEELDKYLERLRKRYKIKIAEIDVRNDNYESKKKTQEYDDIIEKIVYNKNRFKTIKYINKDLKDKFLKEKHIHIVLDEK